MKHLILSLAFSIMVLAETNSLSQLPVTSGTKISTTTKIKPGTYNLTDPGSGMIQITGSNYTLDLRGVKIVGPGNNKGTGIHITDARTITIKGVSVTGCGWGILLERCSGIKFEDCNSSHNGDLPPGTVIDESGKEPEDQHGGGILLRDCKNCSFRRCTAQHQWDGIDMVRSDGNIFEDGDTSYNNNWGIHLWSASRNTFRRNRAIWCTTGAGTLYQALTGWQTYDAQAVGIDHASCDNLIEDNDLRFGGDAIFIRANEGGITPGTQVPPKNSSDRNILRGNDCSFSPNNAIEVDFVEGTIIENNNCSNSHYGLWLGYSRGTIVRRNTCINDTSHAIEIENGQNILIENNLFGFDEVRPDVPLIYLRQNGNDKTPSGLYIVRSNIFYGTSRGIRLRDTTAELSDNLILWTGRASATLVEQEKASKFTESGTRYTVQQPNKAPRLFSLPARIKAGSIVTVRTTSQTVPVAIAVDGIPVWVKKENRDTVTFLMPSDFWDRPGPDSAEVRVFEYGRWQPGTKVAIDWLGVPRVSKVFPTPAKIGDTISVEGESLQGELMLNNRSVEVKRESTNRLTFKVPEGILVSTKYNLIIHTPKASTWPVTFAVNVPRETQPHIVNATFTPTTLKSGEILTVTFTVRNNLPVNANLVTFPAPIHTYEEGKAGWEIGVKEPPGTLHLRATSDHPGNNNPGSWPWFFGFDKPKLGPGETVTVTGHIRVETPGVHEFRVGLVASGFHFIDDNAFRTKVTVLPK